jgi:adenosylcobinamide kinase/adenosylcobinamide-phosphate guanylyltransferase
VALVVITGGIRSGKSGAAQRLAEARALDGASVAVAVFGRASDEEMAARVARHQARRPAGFSTAEAVDPLSWRSEVPDASLLVVDCLGTLLGLTMETAWSEAAEGSFAAADPAALPPHFAEKVSADFEQAVEWLLHRAGDTIVVTNEVGLSVVPAWASARLFCDLLGNANHALVAGADAAYFALVGRLLDLAAMPTAVQWPED